MHIDGIDSALINELRADGRMTFEALGSRVGLSRTAARTRVQRLIDTGVLRVTGVVHPSVHGLHIQGLVCIEVSGQALEIAERIAAMEDAPFVSVVSGRFGVIAEVWSPRLDAFTVTLQAIRALEGVRAVETAIYTKMIKDPYWAPPVEFLPLDLDDLDRSILAALQADGRVSFADMADTVGLSPGGIRARILRLTGHGVVHVTGLVEHTRLGLTHACSFALWATRAIDPILREIAGLPQIFGLAAAVGRCDIVGTISASTQADVLATLDQIRQMPGLSRLESWSHLTPLKENYERSPADVSVSGRKAPRRACQAEPPAWRRRPADADT